ncbi:phage terminase large subunit family protein [Caloramator sp. CAR-1]|uniref:phage terminase large subunit family protein n=1 Tax=Caloramator sp. CAR-1 TaxID=3062777 RepID=UPI0026E3C5AC|nr:phage terminase large subunit family protein [Caloramator sp. CAR-1]MDO6355292.1 phage terminase large subunit family protein [Caloramator sp. CAR-1]
MKRKTLNLFKKILKAVAPPPRLKISEWADKNRRLSSETSAEPGPWRTDRAPYQREIMDSLNDSKIEKVVVMSSSQVGKSEMINNIIGYYIDIDPGPMLLIQPTLEMAQDYSKRRISTMIRDTECLRNKVSDSKSRDLNNTILMKVFPGGFLAIGGANSPAGLASRPVRILLADEVDRYPISAGTEGDPLMLAEKRTITFWNRKKVFVSTPTIKGASRIEMEYEQGTQEKWCLKCPNCGEYQFINLYGIKFNYDKDDKGNYKVWDVKFQCPNCLESFDEFTWKNQPGKWIASNPEAQGVRSFFLNAFVSPWYSWENIILEWLRVKNDPEQYKVFKNTILGESWEEKGNVEDEEMLLKRCEEYEAELPEGVLILTAGVDVQDDRLEYEVVGWGKGYESWGIEYGKILGSPEMPSTWQMLLDKLTKSYSFKDGTSLTVACTCIDSGGHFTSEVYKFCKENEYRRIFAIKGKGGQGINYIFKVSRTRKENAALFTIGVDNGKAKIMSRLKIKEPGPGYCHFPNGRGYDRTYFRGLTSERIVRKKINGQIKLVWEKINDTRNEPLDVRNYATAAIEILNPTFEEIEKRLKALKEGIEYTEQRPKRKYGVIKKGIEV